MDQSEGRQSEVRLCLAAAGREEEQIHRATIGRVGIDNALQVQEQERKLKRPPGRFRPRHRAGLLAAGIPSPSLEGHRRVGKRERAEHIGAGEQLDPLANPIGRDACGVERESRRSACAVRSAGLPSGLAALRSRPRTDRPGRSGPFEHPRRISSAASASIPSVDSLK